ncbi:MAG: HD domain-containing protein, partial [Spirochaetales bacterium]|nr:HD domain-containing protein [Spirochaetales bacterium]
SILLLVPFVVGVVTITGFLSILSVRVALTRIATRVLAYKAEQIRDFAHSQWELLVELGLENDILYVQTAKSAIQSYAGSTIRSESELVLAIDPFGFVEISTGHVDVPGVGELARIVREQDGGWIEFEGETGPRVAQAFIFEPFDWVVLTSEQRDAFFSEIGQITRTIVVIASIASIIGVVIALWFASIVGRPIEIVTAAMRDIRNSGDLGKSVPVLSSDEIGVLAGEFNMMNGMLARSHRELAERADAEYRAKQATLEREYEALIVLAKATEFKDMETGQHLFRVGEMGRMLGELVGLGEFQQELLFRAGPLHDVGKIGVPDAILMKPGALDSEERRTMESHTTIGYRILSQTKSRFLRLGAYIAHTHHERWDGTGYPRGLTGTAIPLFGRIVGLVDVLDALTSERPYKRAWSTGEAFEEIERCSGSHFDPLLAHKMLEHRTRFADLIERAR